MDDTFSNRYWARSTLRSMRALYTQRTMNAVNLGALGLRNAKESQRLVQARRNQNGTVGIGRGMKVHGLHRGLGHVGQVGVRTTLQAQYIGWQ
jgi:L-aminopeptidase/D-esterase-like protein